MDRIIYEYDFDDEFGHLDELDEEREPTRIIYEYENDFNIFEFKLLCIKLAGSIGYSPDSINEAFGKDSLPLEKEALRQAQIKDLIWNTTWPEEKSGIPLHRSASEDERR